MYPSTFSANRATPDTDAMRTINPVPYSRYELENAPDRRTQRFWFFADVKDELTAVNILRGWIFERQAERRGEVLHIVPGWRADAGSARERQRFARVSRELKEELDMMADEEPGLDGIRILMMCHEKHRLFLKEEVWENYNPTPLFYPQPTRGPHRVLPNE